MNGQHRKEIWGDGRDQHQIRTAIVSSEHSAASLKGRELCHAGVGAVNGDEPGAGGRQGRRHMGGVAPGHVHPPAGPEQTLRGRPPDHPGTADNERMRHRAIVSGGRALRAGSGARRRET